MVRAQGVHQHVHEVPGYRRHKEDPLDPVETQYGPAHPVTLVAGGLLHRLAGADTVTVNSLHSQGVKKLAGGVTVEALADDGLVEAFTVDDVPGFALAVQWHPEELVGDGRNWDRGLFHDFAAAVERHRKGRAG